MYIGRDHDSKEGLDMLDHYQDMSDSFDDPQDAIRQMVEKLPLPDYLKEGIEILRKHRKDIDSL
jgi:hypothetical protein